MSSLWGSCFLIAVWGDIFLFLFLFGSWIYDCLLSQRKCHVFMLKEQWASSLGACIGKNCNLWCITCKNEKWLRGLTQVVKGWKRFVRGLREFISQWEKTITNDLFFFKYKEKVDHYFISPKLTWILSFRQNSRDLELVFVNIELPLPISFPSVGHNSRLWSLLNSTQFKIRSLFLTHISFFDKFFLARISCQHLPVFPSTFLGLFGSSRLKPLLGL